jgi:5-formyltetrahydrofolate cyclo-ligase
MTIETLAEPKADLRKKALARRRALEPSDREAFSARLADEGAKLARRLGSRVVSAFHPIGDEPDTLGLLRELAERGLVTALPVTGSRRQPLRFRAWRPGEPTIAGPLRILEPPPSAREVEPDLLFVPLAAFDRRGHRIGYGAGHYDRALAALRARGPVRAVGVAYSVCEVAAVPDEPHDEPLDFVLTDREWIDARDAR